MRKTLSLFLLLFCSLAFAQTKNEKEPSTESILTIRKIVSKIEKMELGKQIKEALSTPFVILDSNNKQELETFLKGNATFFDKKIVAADSNEKSVSKVFLNYNYSAHELIVEIQNISNGSKLNYKTINYNYYTEK